MKITAVAFVGFTLAVLPDLAASAAQTSSVVSIDAGDSLRFAKASKRVKPGSTLHVYTQADPSRSLQFRGTDIAPWGFGEAGVPDSARWAGREPGIRWSEVQKIQVKGRATGTGAALGMLLLGAAGTAFGIGVAKDDFLTPNPTDDTEVIAGFAVMGALGGALLGTVIGTMIPTHKTVYEASKTAYETETRK